MSEIAYTVRGSWPFPLDMLRHDGSRAATEADQALIGRLSQESASSREDFQPVEINLIADWKPNSDRWESFGWDVPTDADHAFMKRARAEAARAIEADRLRDAASELLAALEAFQQHVIRHACVWDDAKNGSHHHPIWQQVSEAISKATGA